MCGIFASIGLSRGQSTYMDSLLTMTHRGPDFQNGIAMDDRLFLGHARLSILDLNPRSNQPFTSDNFHIIFNGEVYNYKELIQEHQLTVKTTSDTEVILEMYKKYQSGCLQYFNGMFTLLIYNQNNGDIFIARDRLGIKPLYYYNHEEEWLFSSELAGIQNIIHSDTDDFGLRQYRKLRMTIKGYTLYKDIKQFPSGHFWLNGKLQQYWELDYSPKSPPKDEELEALIGNAVDIRRRADVPVGSFLSGGLDSTILSYLLKPEDTWTVGFDEANEFEWGKLANRDLSSNHHQLVVNSTEFLNTAAWMIEKRKEPLSVPNEVLIYLMSEKVREKNIVILSGEGADELFWGYDRIFKWAHQTKNLEIAEFDQYYCYGSNKDDEVIKFALENLPGDTVLEKVGYYFQIFHLQGLLRRLDNSTMLSSIEARVPFVDHRLVEMMAGTPFEWKMGDSFKSPLKRIYEKLIPNEIINRKKIGFPVPLKAVFENQGYSGTPMDQWLLFNLDKFQTKVLG